MAEDADRQEGAASAELAVALPAVAVVLAAVLSVGQVVLTQVRCVDAARAGARAAARGEAPGQVWSLSLAQAPGATVTVGRSGASVTVEVTRSVSVLLPDGPTVRVVGRAAARAEDARGAAAPVSRDGSDK